MSSGLSLFLRFLCVLYFDFASIWAIVLRGLYILGAWLLFSKFGVNRKLALVPWVREYQLGVCAKKETEGRVFCILSVVITALSVTGLFLTEFSELENPIIQTLIPLIAVLLASVFLMYFIYNIRIFSGLIRQLGLRKRWWLVPCIFNGVRCIPMLIWGLSSRYQPIQKGMPPAAGEITRPAGEGLKLHPKGYLRQIGSHLLRFIIMFVKQRDWMMVPMAVIMSGMLGIAVRNGFRSTMEMTLMGAYGMTVVCIWVGCFNSITSICRERELVRREFRLGLRMSSYLIADLLYQGLLCLFQTFVILLVTYQVGVDYSGAGLFTPWFIVDFGITIFLVTYAADMMSLCISALVHTPTTSLRILPFVLIFQLIFSEGLIPFPESVKPITVLSISSPSLTAMRAQTDINSREFSMVTTVLDMMDDTQIEQSISLGQVLDMLSDQDNPSIVALRKMKVGKVMTLREVLDTLLNDPKLDIVRDHEVFSLLTVGDILHAIREAGLLEKQMDIKIGVELTVGDILDYIISNKKVQEFRDKTLKIDTTMGAILDVVGKEKVQGLLQEKAIGLNYNPEYACTRENVLTSWLNILIFILVFPVAALIALQFIDTDKKSSGKGRRKRKKEELLPVNEDGEQDKDDQEKLVEQERNDGDTGDAGKG